MFYMSHKNVTHPANHPVFAAFSPEFREGLATSKDADEWFRLESLYDINDDAQFVDPFDGQEEDYFDEDLAYAQMLERRAENGTWWGRDDDYGDY